MGGVVTTTKFVRKNSDNFSEEESVSYSSENSLVDGTHVLLTPAILAVIRNSWSTISSMCRDGETFTTGGLHAFCELFFHKFSHSLDSGIIQIYKPRLHATSASNRNELLTRHIDYMVDLPDQSMKTKRKLRSLGRQHVRLVGVGGYHFNIFLTILQNSIRERLSDLYTSEMEVAWSSLLNFVVVQLTMDREPIAVVSRTVLSRSSSFSQQVEQLTEHHSPNKASCDADGGDKHSHSFVPHLMQSLTDIILHPHGHHQHVADSLGTSDATSEHN